MQIEELIEQLENSDTRRMNYIDHENEYWPSTILSLDRGQLNHQLLYDGRHMFSGRANGASVNSIAVEHDSPLVGRWNALLIKLKEKRNGIEARRARRV